MVISSILNSMTRGIIDKNLKYAKFRFNQAFHLVGADDFLKDMFNDKEIQNALEPLTDILSCTGVKYKHLSA